MNARCLSIFLGLFVIVSFFESSVLFAAFPSGFPGQRRAHSRREAARVQQGFGYNVRVSSPMLDKVDQDDALRDAIFERKEELQTLRAKQAAAKSNGKSTADLDQEITHAEDLIKQLQHRRSHLFLSSTAGTLIARGFAGAGEWEMLDDTKITNVKDGLVQGLTLRASKAVGDVLGKRIEGSCEVVLGGAWDTMFGWLVDSWEALCLLLFHEDKKPFQPEALEGWLDLTQKTLNDIERMVKDGLRDSLRGCDMTRRKFDLVDGAMSDAVGSQSSDAQENVWVSLAVGYADQFERVAQEIADRCEYYKETSLEAFYATQIIRRLLHFKELLITSKSLSDFDAKINSNKAMITATKTNIENLFKRLVVKVTPRTYSLKNGSDVGYESSFREKGSSSSDGYSNRMSSGEDLYPSSGW